MNKTSKKQGSGLMEIVVGVSIISLTLFGIMTVVITAFNLMGYSTMNVQASYLLEEGIEVMRIFRDAGWNSYINSLTIDTPYYLVFENNNWLATTTAINIDGKFNRTFVLQNVNRNVSDDIVESGGVIDVGTKKIIMSVEWQSKKGTSTKEIVSYLSDIFNN
ncbi:hypothetical protein ACFLY5_00965 [Patescibacteria group bacterium]